MGNGWTDALAAALAPAFERGAEGARRLAATVAAEVGDAADPEASVRIAGGAVRGGRMMIERASVECARSIARGLSLPWGSRSESIASSCAALELPLITGWDVGVRQPMYKLYANASDASAVLRDSLFERLEIGGPAGHVVGLNVGPSSTATKVYHQARHLEELALDDAPPRLLAEIDAAAWVASYDVRGGARALRAVFAAPAHGDEETAREVVRALSGVSFDDVAARLPFPAGPIRQVGWSPSGVVTVYVKRRGAAAPVHALEPQAVFRAGDVEVGLVVEPSEGTPRAFLRTERHAITLRTRQGTPDREAIEQLGRWAGDRVRAAERAAAALDFAGPPAPWSRVDDASVS